MRLLPDLLRLFCISMKLKSATSRCLRPDDLARQSGSPNFAPRCFALLGILCALQISVSAGEVTAVIKSHSLVYRLDAVTGAYKGSIQVDRALGVGCDGTTIAVLLGNGFVNRYDAQSGAYRGSFQVGDGPQSVQVSGGVIAVRTAHQLKRYKASNGAFLGSSQI